MDSAHSPDPRVPLSPLALVIAGIFVLSGATSLVYQVAWVRMLSLFFGSDVACRRWS